ncbi:MAG: sugar phosphate isomerase/epimerase family protein [Kiritimatiellia bacterium]|nr:sugar phosphate isomerase/epimerase family protein [Kiritimatiellia bacterium]
MKSFKYSINTNALKKEMEPKETVALAVECKLDGIEWGIRSMANAANEMKEMAQRTKDAGLEIVSWLIGGKPWKKDDLKKRVELVASVGGKSMRVDHPWVAWNLEESLHQEKSFNEIFKLAKDAMPFLIDMSRQSGIRFLFETHSGALLASSLAVKMLFEGVSPEHVGVIYDPANTTVEGNLRPRSEVEVLGKYIAYVHAKSIAFFFDGTVSREPLKRITWSYKTVSPDAGALDWVEVFFALKNGGFTGFISSEEYFSPKNLNAIKEGVAFLKECEKLSPEKPCQPFTKFNE